MQSNIFALENNIYDFEILKLENASVCDISLLDTYGKLDLWDLSSVIGHPIKSQVIEINDSISIINRDHHLVHYVFKNNNMYVNSFESRRQRINLIEPLIWTSSSENCIESIQNDSLFARILKLNERNPRKIVSEIPYVREFNYKLGPMIMFQIGDTIKQTLEYVTALTFYTPTDSITEKIQVVSRRWYTEFYDIPIIENISLEFLYRDGKNKISTISYLCPPINQPISTIKKQKNKSILNIRQQDKTNMGHNTLTTLSMQNIPNISYDNFKLTISFSNPYLMHNYDIIMSDVLGRHVKFDLIKKGNDIIIEAADYPYGWYILSIMDNGVVLKTFKFYNH